MTRYFRFEKATSRGTLGHDVALDGLVLRQRTRKGENKKTGKVGGGGQASSTSTFKDAKAAKAAFDKVVKNLAADRYKQVGGPPVDAPAPAKLVRVFTVKGTPKPATAAELDAFEAKHGVKLPTTYRAFAQAHGAGELLGFVRIFVPGKKSRFRLQLLQPYAEAGLFPFADTGGGDIFGWKLPSRAKEPAVHYVRRGKTEAKKVAASFEAFVKGLTTSQAFVERLFPGLDADATFLAR